MHNHFEGGCGSERMEERERPSFAVSFGSFHERPEFCRQPNFYGRNSYPFPAIEINFGSGQSCGDDSYMYRPAPGPYYGPNAGYQNEQYACAPGSEQFGAPDQQWANGNNIGDPSYANGAYNINDNAAMPIQNSAYDANGNPIATYDPTAQSALNFGDSYNRGPSQPVASQYSSDAEPNFMDAPPSQDLGNGVTESSFADNDIYASNAGYGYRQDAPTNVAPVTDAGQTANTAPAGDASQPANTVPVGDASQPANTVPVGDASQPANTVPVGDASQLNGPAANPDNLDCTALAEYIVARVPLGTADSAGYITIIEPVGTAAPSDMPAPGADASPQATNPAQVTDTNAVPALVTDTNAAPIVVTDTNAAPTVVTDTNAAPTVVTDTNAAPTVVTDTNAAPTVVTDTNAAPTVVTDTNAAPIPPVGVPPANMPDTTGNPDQPADIPNLKQ